MNDKKTWGSTVMGWFVVKDQPDGADEGGSSPDDQSSNDVAEAAKQPPVDVFKAPPPAAPGGKVDYDQVFEAAGHRRGRATTRLTDARPADVPAARHGR